MRPKGKIVELLACHAEGHSKIVLERNLRTTHAHPTLRFLSSVSTYLCYKELKLKGRTVVNQAARYHHDQKFMDKNDICRRYIRCKEDLDYMLKYYQKSISLTGPIIELVNGGIEHYPNKEGDQYMSHIFTDCHYYEEVERYIFYLAKNKTKINAVYINGLAFYRNYFNDTTSEIETLRVDGGFIYFQPCGSNGYQHR